MRFRVGASLEALGRYIDAAGVFNPVCLTQPRKLAQTRQIGQITTVINRDFDCDHCRSDQSPTSRFEIAVLFLVKTRAIAVKIVIDCSQDLKYLTGLRLQVSI